MMLDAITLDLGCVSAPAFILPDASGLAPLELPSALVSDTPLPADGASREPLPDAVRRFEAAMGAGEAISDAVPVSRLRAVIVPHEEKRQVVVESVDLRRGVEVQKVVTAPVVVETVDSRGGVEVQKVVAAPVVVETVDSRRDAAAQKVVAAPVVAETVHSRRGVEVQKVVVAPVVAETVDSRRDAEAQRDVAANPVNPVIKEAPQAIADVQEPKATSPKPDVASAQATAPVAAEMVDSRGDAETQKVVTTPVVSETIDSRGGAEAQRDVAANPVNPVNPVIKEAPQAIADVQEPKATSPKPDVASAQATAPVAAEMVDSRGVAETRRDKVSPGNSVKPVVKDAPDAVDQRKVAETVVIVPVATEALAPQAVQVSPDVSAVSAATARTESIVETVNQIAEAVAGQILVTPGIAHGEGEVKIMLKPTVLDGSEITMSSKDGTLTVNIAPATPDAAAAAAAALPRLETALAEHAPAFHHVTVALATQKGSRHEAV